MNIKFAGAAAITALMTFIAAYILYSMLTFSGKAEKLSTENISKIIQKAAVQCYALEGAYPPNIYYLADNYQIELDEDNYIYYYCVYGANIMPEIQVFQID